MMEYFKPLPAQSVGLITNYGCTFKCAHCLYCASPNIAEDIQNAPLEELVQQIDHALGPIPLHIGGGEPLIYFDRIRHLLAVLRKTEIVVEYVETNGSSFINERRKKLLALQNEGLERLLVSISPFHNAFINLAKIKAIIRDILELYGTNGLFPWHPGYLAFLERFSPRETVAVDDYFSRFSRAEVRHQLTSIMYIHPGGRAAYFLARHLPLYPVETVLEKNCRESLASPVHAHLDYGGNYLTGFCSGLRIGKEVGFSLETLYHRGISLSQYPILEILVHGGIKDLYQHALNVGYKPLEGFVSSCHLCLDIRRHLYFHEAKYPELYPDFFYEELGVA
jgi:hypothetical protein